MYMLIRPENLTMTWLCTKVEGDYAELIEDCVTLIEGDSPTPVMLVAKIEDIPPEIVYMAVKELPT